MRRDSTFVKWLGATATGVVLVSLLFSRRGIYSSYNAWLLSSRNQETRLNAFKRLADQPDDAILSQLVDAARNEPNQDLKGHFFVMIAETGEFGIKALESEEINGNAYFICLALIHGVRPLDGRAFESAKRLLVKILTSTRD